MLYVQHLLGIGHLMRARLLAEAIADRGYDVHLVTGGMPIGGRCRAAFEPSSCRRFAFPTRASRRYVTPTSTRSTKRIASADGTLLLKVFAAVAPSAVLFETFPFGRRALRFELFPLLERIEAARPRPLVIGSIREILQLQQKPEREREMLAWAARWFDAIFVHGDRRFARFEDTFSFVADLVPPVHYTGFVMGRPQHGPAVEDGTRRRSSYPRAAAASASSCWPPRSLRNPIRASAI